MPGQIPVATRQFSDYIPWPDLTETAVQDAIPTESYGNSGLVSRCSFLLTPLTWARALKSLHHEADLLEVIGAPVASGEVLVHRGALLGWQHFVEVAGHQLDQLLTGKTTLRGLSGGGGCRRAQQGGDQKSRYHSGGGEDGPGRRADTVGPGEPPEHQRERQEQQPGHSADTGRHPGSDCGRDRVMQQLADVDGDDR